VVEITRLSGRSDLEFVEREWTPHQLMKLGVRLRLTGLSISNLVRNYRGRCQTFTESRTTGYKK